MWAFCLGRDPAEKISVGLKDKLNQVGNLMWSVRVKVCLTVFRKERKAVVKAGPSDPSKFFNGTRM